MLRRARFARSYPGEAGPTYSWRNLLPFGRYINVALEPADTGSIAAREPCAPEHNARLVQSYQKPYKRRLCSVLCEFIHVAIKTLGGGKKAIRNVVI